MIREMQRNRLPPERSLSCAVSVFARKCISTPMDVSSQKEQISFAYVRAVAAFAGCGVQENPYHPDDDSVDVQFRLKTPRRVQLEAQLKCTACEPLGSDASSIAHDLPVKNYEDLRRDVLVPRILIVVTLPLLPIDWWKQSEEELRMRRCGYFMSLAGMPVTDHTTTVRVHVPRGNVFSPEGLTGLMAKIEAGVPL